MADISKPHYAVMRAERITTWSQALWTGRHNARDMDVPNAERDGPEPVHLVGSGDVLADLRAAHARFAPKKKKGAVIGLEFVFSASREAFEDLARKDRTDKAFQLMTTAQRYLEGRFGTDGQVVSIILHMDEITPHIHAVVIPVRLREDMRARERSYFRDTDGKLRYELIKPAEPKMVWMLSAAADMGDKKKLARHQTAWAKCVEGLGLVRGRVGSRDRHKTARERERELDDATANANDRAVAADRVREGFEREMTFVAEETDRLRDQAEDLRRREAQIAADRAALDGTIAAEEARLAGLRSEIAAAQQALDERSAKAAKAAATYKRVGAEMREFNDELEAREAKVARDAEKAAAHGDALARFAGMLQTALIGVDMSVVTSDERRRLMDAAAAVDIAIAEGGKRDPSIAMLSHARRFSSAARLSSAAGR